MAETSNIRKFFESFSWLAVDKLVSLGGAAVVGILLARHLGPSDFGFLSVALALATFALSFSSLGIQGLITRDLSYSGVGEGEVLGSTAALSAIAASVVVTAAGAYYLWAQASLPSAAILVLILICSVILRRFEYLEVWFVFKNKTASYAKPRILITALFVAARLYMIVAGFGLDSFIITYIVEYCLIGVRALGTYWIQKQKDVRWAFNRQYSKDLLARSWPVFLSGILQYIYLKVDILMLTYFRSLDETGIYAAAARLSEIWYFLPVLVMTAAFPRILELKRSDAAIYSLRLQNLLDVLSGSAMLLAIAVALTASWFIPLLFGEAYQAAALILAIHIWASVFVFMRAVLSKWLIAEELYIFSLVTHALGAAINVGLNLVLIPLYGGLGAAVATLLGYATAGYISLWVSPKTRPMAVMMTKALAWPMRSKQAFEFAKQLGASRLKR